MIYLFLNKERYENDIRALLMAFYHGEKILARNMENMADENFEYAAADRILTVIYGDGGLKLELRSGSKELLGEKGYAGLPEDRKEGKNVLKSCLYELLTEVTGKVLPWGTLTGIRPTKIPMAMYEDGKAGRKRRHIFGKHTKCRKKKSVSVPGWLKMSGGFWKAWIIINL